jgi:ribosomal-protein-alanine N-acetyltransferase
MKASYANLTVQHAGLLHAIEAEVATDPWSELSFETHLTAKDSLTIGAVVEDKLVGFVACQIIAGTEVDILQISVAKRCQRLGIGRALVRCIKDRKFDSITLEVRPSNLPALSLYQSEGFQVVGKRKAFYRNGEDALTMRWQKQ